MKVFLRSIFVLASILVLTSCDEYGMDIEANIIGHVVNYDGQVVKFESGQLCLELEWDNGGIDTLCESVTTDNAGSFAIFFQDRQTVTTTVGPMLNNIKVYLRTSTGEYPGNITYNSFRQRGIDFKGDVGINFTIDHDE